MSQGFAELRDGIFAKVAQRAIRRIALMAFRHLHRLSLRFHLDRQTGGLTRAIERGAKGIEFLLTFLLFNVVPTLLEIGLVCIILWRLYDVWFAAVTRSEEHTSELQSLMRISYAVFCLKKK